MYKHTGKCHVCIIKKNTLMTNIQPTNCTSKNIKITKFLHNSILGMNLFGCKFCDKSDGDDDTQCDRKNFDTLLWALVGFY